MAEFSSEEEEVLTKDLPCSSTTTTSNEAEKTQITPRYGVIETTDSHAVASAKKIRHFLDTAKTQRPGQQSDISEVKEMTEDVIFELQRMEHQNKKVQEFINEADEERHKARMLKKKLSQTQTQLLLTQIELSSHKEIIETLESTIKRYEKRLNNKPLRAK